LRTNLLMAMVHRSQILQEFLTATQEAISAQQWNE